MLVRNHQQNLLKQQHHYQKIEIYNSVIHYAGKPAWDPLTVKLRDDVTGAVSKLVGEQNQQQFDFFEQSSASSGIDYKFTTKIEILDGGNGTQTPNTLETFECYGCFVQNADYGDLNYTTNEPATVALTIRFDNAIQYKGGAVDGIGRNIGARSIGVLTTG